MPSGRRAGGAPCGGAWRGGGLAGALLATTPFRTLLDVASNETPESARATSLDPHMPIAGDPPSGQNDNRIAAGWVVAVARRFGYSGHSRRGAPRFRWGRAR
ncbi:MAG: hypothetical protein AB7I09_19575 [Planctomycetota bacterium]